MFAWAYAITTTKSIHANTFQINLITGIITQITGALIYPFTTNTITYSELLLAILLTGIPLTVMQTLYITALKMSTNSGMITITGFISVGVGYLVSVFRYGEKPDLVTSAGVGLALFGVWLTIFGK